MKNRSFGAELRPLDLTQVQPRLRPTAMPGVWIDELPDYVPTRPGHKARIAGAFAPTQPMQLETR